MTYPNVTRKEFLSHKDIIALWTRSEDIPADVKHRIFDPEGSGYDYYTPLAKGKEWLFELTCKHQPRTGALLMQGGPLFVRVRAGDAVSLLLDMGLEVHGKVILIRRGFWQYNPDDPGYQAQIERVNANLTKNWGRPMKSEERHLSLPLPIREAYYFRFDGMSIPAKPISGPFERLLPFPIGRPWQSWDHYLENLRGYKKKYIPWLEERIPGIKKPFNARAYTSFMMFMAAGPNPAGKEGDVFFVKNAEGMQDGVIYHIKDADIENMRILTEPAEAIDRYCEHMLLEKEGRFDFLPYGSPM